MDSHSRPQRASGFHLEQVDDELLLYQPGGNRILQLNQPASLIWHLCDGQRTIDALIKLLQEAYPESAAEISADMQEILQQFLDNGCIEMV